MQVEHRTTLAQDFVLSTYLDHLGRMAPFNAGLDFGVSGAVLLELVMERCIQLRDGHLVARDSMPTGSYALDDTLARIRGSAAAHSCEWWVKDRSVATRKMVLSELTDAGILGPVNRRHPLPLVPHRRLVFLHPEARRAAVDRIAGAVDASGQSASLAALAAACGMIEADQTGDPRAGTAASDELTAIRTEILAAVRTAVRLTSLLSWT